MGDFELEWLFSLIAIPVVAHFFKKHESKFEEHDKRMDEIENTYATKSDAQRETDRVNQIFKEVFATKADKELVKEMVKK